MLGAIIGDVVGSRYEFANIKSKSFPMFHPVCTFTDDTVCTIAVAKTLIDNSPIDYSDEGLNKIKKDLINNFKHFVEKYPNYGYGGSFFEWAMSDSKEPYNSWGNGSGMRISPVGWIANSEEEVKKLSKAVSEVTHNHLEGIKGAEAIAMCIFMARLGKTKDEIKEYIYDNYYPELDYLDYEELLDTYEFDVSCQGSVPQAIFCFLIGEGFNDVIKTAVSIGGDSDTIACMAGAIAEAYYINKQDITPTIKKFNENISFPKEFVDITNNFLKLIKNDSYKLEYKPMAGKKVYR